MRQLVPRTIWQLIAPQHMSFKGDFTNWRVFQENWEDYLVATGLQERQENTSSHIKISHGQ